MMRSAMIGTGRSVLAVLIGLNLSLAPSLAAPAITQVPPHDETVANLHVRHLLQSGNLSTGNATNASNTSSSGDRSITDKTGEGLQMRMRK